MKYELNKVYDITHSRKGRFFVRIESEDDEWVTGEIVSGTASALLDHNVKETGEKITMRKSLIQKASIIHEGGVA